MAAIVTRRTRARQPQQPALIDWNSEFLSGGTLLALVNGTNRAVNLANGAANVQSGTVLAKGGRTAIGAYNSGTAGDIGISNTNIGGSLYVDFWHGVYLAGGPANGYLFGDYNGSSGSGLAGRHNNVSGHWGWFNGSSVSDGGETLVSGNLYTFVVVRDTLSGNVKIYRDGGLKLTDAAAPNGPMAFGSIGQGQYATFGCESITLLAGRIRFKSWTPEQVKRFSANPWALFKAQPRRLWLAYSSGTSNTGTIATTLTGTLLSASGQVVDAGTFASTLAGASLAASGLVASPPSGALASTLSGATMAAIGSVTNAGALASTLAGATMSAAGTVTNRGALASQLDGAGLAASGSVITIPAGALSSTLDGAALAAGGYVGTPPAGPDFFIRLPKNPRHVIHHH